MYTLCVLAIKYVLQWETIVKSLVNSIRTMIYRLTTVVFCLVCPCISKF